MPLDSETQRMLDMWSKGLEQIFNPERPENPVHESVPRISGEDAELMLADVVADARL